MKQGILKTFFDSETPLTNKEEQTNTSIIDMLNRYNCNVVQTVMGTEWSFSSAHGKESAENIYNSKIEDIRASDLFVCELSSPSANLLFEIFEALNQKKPTLVLIEESSDYRPDIALLGNPSRFLTVAQYNHDNLEEKISGFVDKAKSKRPTKRFTVRFSKELDDYVNHLKVKRKLSSKNDVVVEVLEQMMNEDYSY